MVLVVPFISLLAAFGVGVVVQTWSVLLPWRFSRRLAWVLLVAFACSIVWQEIHRYRREVLADKGIYWKHGAVADYEISQYATHQVILDDRVGDLHAVYFLFREPLGENALILPLAGAPYSPRLGQRLHYLPTREAGLFLPPVDNEPMALLLADQDGRGTELAQCIREANGRSDIACTTVELDPLHTGSPLRLLRCEVTPRCAGCP